MKVGDLSEEELKALISEVIEEKFRELFDPDFGLELKEDFIKDLNESLASKERIPFEEVKNDYLLFLGRITTVKGIIEAIETAKKSGLPLVIVAKVDPVDSKFFKERVEPLLDGKQTRYVGEADNETKIEYLKKARALLFPILWEEPFGLVMVEALACGTPVIAFRRGSVPEIIEDGVNGFIVTSVDEMAAAVKKLPEISPRACRDSVEVRFALKRMVDEYEKLFIQAISEQRAS